MYAFLKPVSPSKTLAIFLGNNTNLPYLVWWIILKFKYDYEEKNLRLSKSASPKSFTHILRSKNKYVSNIDKKSLTDCWFSESYNLCNNFERALRSKVKKTITHDKMIYDCLISHMNYLMNWIHIIVFNSNQSDYIKHFLECGMFHSITRIYNDIYKPHTVHDANYRTWCREIVDDLKSVKDYVRCPCDWRSNPQNKCCQCIDFEQYFYHYDTYGNNFTVLRSQRMIRKTGGIIEKPIIIQKVYRLL